MRHTLTILTLLVFAFTALGGCTTPEETESNTENEEKHTPESNNNNPRTPETTDTELELAFVSGHFGTYWDCPDQAYTQGEGDPLPSGEAGDCAEEDCGFLNCEGAQVSVDISNIGDEDATGLRVTDISIVDSEGAILVSLPILAQTPLTDGFAGTLVPGDSVLIRTDFQGPLQLSEFTDEARAQPQALLQITVESDNAPTVILVTPHLAPIPEIAT